MQSPSGWTPCIYSCSSNSVQLLSTPGMLSCLSIFVCATDTMEADSHYRHVHVNPGTPGRSLTVLPLATGKATGMRSLTAHPTVHTQCQEPLQNLLNMLRYFCFFQSDTLPLGLFLNSLSLLSFFFSYLLIMASFQLRKLASSHPLMTNCNTVAGQNLFIPLDWVQQPELLGNMFLLVFFQDSSPMAFFVAPSILSILIPLAWTHCGKISVYVCDWGIKKNKGKKPCEKYVFSY